MSAFKRQVAMVERLREPHQELADRWIEESLDWLAEEFGRDVLLRPVAIPAEFVPRDYDGTDRAARELFHWVCVRMRVDPDTVRLWFHDRPVLSARWSGRWIPGEDRNQIMVGSEDIATPDLLVATYAHELSHELLLGGHRIDPDRPDLEPLTDLTAILHGFGIFTVNAAYHELPLTRFRRRPARRGYLGETAAARALAYYARLRGEPTMPWRRHLDLSARASLW